MVSPSEQSPEAQHLIPEFAAGIDDAYLFLGNLEAQVTPDQLVADRQAQARLARIMPELRSSLRPGIIPVIKLVHHDSYGAGFEYQHNSFRLHERYGAKHRYYFDEAWPTPKLPAYLREQDVVPSGIYTGFTVDRTGRLQLMEELGIDADQVDRLIDMRDPRVKHLVQMYAYKRSRISATDED